MSKSKSKKVETPIQPTDAEIILRVASLIEEGSHGMRQIIGKYFTEDKKACCALGACYNALGNHPATAALMELLNINTWPRIPYPEGSYTPFAANEQMGTAALPDVVIYLNDRLKWSFSKIVDYLRDLTLPKATTNRQHVQKR